MKGIKGLLVGIGLAMTISAAADVTVYELLPWPWGTECPFPWRKIEGNWTVRSSENHEHFSFIVKGTWENGTRILEVQRYTGKGLLIGLGEGVAPRSERIVRAAMTGVGPEEGKSYWALVRTYVEKKKLSCARGKQVTVITLRPTDGSSDDVHLIVDKEEDDNSGKQH